MRSGSRATGRCLRAWACALSLSALLALAGAGPPAAMSAGLSGGSALSELTESQPEETATSTTSTRTTNTSQPTNSSTTVLLALVAAALLLSAIAFVIVRDARKVAPANETDVIEARSAHDHAVRLRKRRAKAKAARQQRKRNR